MLEWCWVSNVRIGRMSMTEVLEDLARFIASGTPHQIVTVNLDFIRIAQHDATFRDAVNQADLSVADGMPLIWLSRLLRAPLPERITGIDLTQQCAALAAAHGYSLYLLGGEPGVAELAADALARRHAALRIAGMYAPPVGPFTAGEERRMIDGIRAARPDILLVAFGAPRQDVWIRAHLEELDVPVCIGVGGTFNFLARRQPRAPRWLQNIGLEWAHRLVHEPRRLWRRYLLGDLPLVARIALAAIPPIRG
jgi:N-acetylglucosaminyldiphosphoundecaprenol N-acetyl-beta-D-mannosaminyltransferase